MRSNQRAWIHDWDLFTNGNAHEINASEVSNFHNFKTQFWRQCIRRRITCAAVKMVESGTIPGDKVIIFQAKRDGKPPVWATANDMMFRILR